MDSPPAVAGSSGQSARIGLGPGAEFDRIRRALGGARTPDPRLVPVGPGDDCAIDPAGEMWSVVTLSPSFASTRAPWISSTGRGSRSMPTK